MTSDRHSIPPYPLRLPPDLRTTLEESAKRESRSLHAEILARLQAGAKPEKEKLLMLADSLATRELELFVKETQIEALKVSLTLLVLHLAKNPPDDPAIKEIINEYIDYVPPASFFDDRLEMGEEKYLAARSARLKLYNKSPIFNTLKTAAKSLLQPKKKDEPPSK